MSSLGEHLTISWLTASSVRTELGITAWPELTSQAGTVDAIPRKAAWPARLNVSPSIVTCNAVRGLLRRPCLVGPPPGHGESPPRPSGKDGEPSGALWVPPLHGVVEPDLAAPHELLEGDLWHCASWQWRPQTTDRNFGLAPGSSAVPAHWSQGDRAAPVPRDGRATRTVRLAVPK